MWKHLLDVGRAFEREIVDAHQHAVAGDGEILLDEIGALLERFRISRDRVLGGICRRPAVCDQLLLRALAAPARGSGQRHRQRGHTSPWMGFPLVELKYTTSPFPRCLLHP